ncbi:putative sensor histidine kinase pdtaS [Methanosarcinales archaeon]|nr:putative sensor histidine kinase pdtaS [Methanosarcinales archaeon]
MVKCLNNYFLGLKELDDAIGEMKKGSNLLLIGPSLTGKEAILNQIISYGATEKDNAVMMVTTREPGIQILDYLKNMTPDLPLSNVGIVDCVSQMFDNNIVETKNIKIVNSPVDLTGIGVKISQFFEDFYIKKNIFNIQLHINSLSTIMMYSNLQTVFRFLNVYTGRIRAAGGLGIYVIESGVHDEKSIATLKQLCDGLIEVKSEKDRNFLRIVIYSGKSTPWFEYEILNGKIKIVGLNISRLNSDDKVSLSGIIRNITEGKNTKKELLESKIYYRRLFETAKEGILILDASSEQITDANPFLINMLGFSSEELLGKKLGEISSFKDFNSNEAFSKLENKERVYYDHLSLETKNKKPIDVEFSCEMFLANRTKVIQCNISEITRHKIIQESLIASESRYRQLFEVAKDGILILDEETGQITDINPSLINILGYSLKELLGKKIWDIGLFKDNGDNKDFFIGIAGKENIHYEDLQLRIKGGKYINVEFISNSFQINNKKLIQCNIRNITEHKLKGRNGNEERYRRLVDFSPFGIIIQSHDKIDFLNPAAMKILGGTKPEELVGKTISQFIHPDYLEIFDEQNCKERNGEIEELIDAKFARFDGTYVDIEIMSIPFNYESKSAIYRVFQDITKRRQADDRIKASLKEKEILLREIHHRVKNNMQIISSLLKLQSKYIEDDKYLDLFKESRNMIESMAIIHERLYHSEDLSKINIKEYTRDLVNNLFHVYNINKSVINSKINVDTVTLGMDFAILCGLIINELVTNSIKYAFPDNRKGEIEIAFRQTDENNFELVVSDNGVGIPEDLDIRKTQSLGLRLITMLVDDQLEGEINLVRGKGTEFQIKFKGAN